MKSNLKNRGAMVYRLASAIKFAAFKFLAATTAIFIWASFHHYFLDKFGPAVAGVMGIVAIIVMYFLIDKGLDALIEFLADEKINPGEQDESENPKARRWFFRTVIFLAAIRLVATGTTSIWGSFEIADYITEAPDHTASIGQMEDENTSLTDTRKSLEKQLAQAKNTERDRVKKAKSEGAAMVVAALSQHSNPEVRAGLRSGKGWYMTTPKLKKVRAAYLAAIGDSARIVQTEAGKVATIEAELLALNTEGFKRTQGIKETLARAEESKVRSYEAKKSRRTNFLIIADLLSVMFGLLAVWVRSTFRAAVGVHSVMEEKTIEGILLAAVSGWWNAFLGGLERALKVDLDGNGQIGMAGRQGETPKRDTRQKGETLGAVAISNRRQIGFKRQDEEDDNDVSDTLQADFKPLGETQDKRQIAKRLYDAKGCLRKYESRYESGKVTLPTYERAIAKWTAEIQHLEDLLNS